MYIHQCALFIVHCQIFPFWNLRHLRRSLKDARVYVQTQNGERTVLVRRDASAETWAKAEAFLTR